MGNDARSASSASACSACAAGRFASVPDDLGLTNNGGIANDAAVVSTLFSEDGNEHQHNGLYGSGCVRVLWLRLYPRMGLG